MCIGYYYPEYASKYGQGGIKFNNLLQLDLLT